MVNAIHLLVIGGGGFVGAFAMQLFTISTKMITDSRQSAADMQFLRSRDIASLMWPDERSVLAWLARQVKDNGIVVETGTAFGGSAKVLRENLPSSCMLICIDEIWRLNDMHGAYQTLNSNRYDRCHMASWQNPLDFVKEYIGNTEHVRFIAETSPYGLTDKVPDAIDLLFEDSAHTSPQLEDNLEFWWPRIKPGGILAGHDFSMEYVHVIDTVLQMSKRVGCEFHVRESVFWIHKPKS